MFIDRSRKQTVHIKREIKTCTEVGQRQTGPKERVLKIFISDSKRTEKWQNLTFEKPDTANIFILSFTNEQQSDLSLFL